jgi:hypothetical protein
LLRVDKGKDQYSDQETARRMTDAIRRALNAPPKPHKEIVGNGKRAGGKRKSRVKKSDR